MIDLALTPLLFFFTFSSSTTLGHYINAIISMWFIYNPQGPLFFQGNKVDELRSNPFQPGQYSNPTFNPQRAGPRSMVSFGKWLSFCDQVIIFDLFFVFSEYRKWCTQTSKSAREALNAVHAIFEKGLGFREGCQSKASFMGNWENHWSNMEGHAWRGKTRI